MSTKQKVFIGSVFKLTSGRDAVVTEFLPKNRCIINILGTSYYQQCLRFKLSSGEVRDNYFPCVAGVGYFGDGKHKAFANGRSTRAYVVWTHILERCYLSDESTTPTYREVEVCKEWYNFQNFAEWFYQQQGHNIKGWQIEKDIYFFHTRKLIYCPESCFFVPRSINNQFLLREADRGELPLGISKQAGKFYARVQFKNKREHSPRFVSLQNAVDWYYEKKAQRIRELADEFKELLDEECYLLLKTIKLFDPAITA